MLYPNPQIYHHLKTIFVHVPKAAGTSIERRLRMSEKDVVGGHTTALAFQRKYPEEFSIYYKFTVVREPVERFLSAYSYLKQMSVHPALNNEVVHACASVNEFVERIQEQPGILRNIVHLLPQHEFVCGRKGEIMVDSVFRFEALEQGWEEICRRVGIPFRALEKLNPSRKNGGGREATDDTVAFIRKQYARDSEIFAYQGLERPIQ